MAPALKTALVDISNFTMFEYGRPNHVYDADKVKGGIYVRKSEEFRKEFTAIGSEEYTLDENITVIADDEKVLAIAGVIGGGKAARLMENTKNILIEVANFDPHSGCKCWAKA